MSNPKLILPLTGLLIFFLSLVWLPAASQQPNLSSTETPNPASDTIFRKATNSPGYLVVKKTDWERLKKIWMDSLARNNDLLINERVNYQSKFDSIQQTSKSIELPEGDPKPESQVSTPSNSTPISLLIGIAILLVYGVIITFQFFNQRNGRKSQVDRLEQIEEDFNRHKKSSIERERKLMRELIDTRNELVQEKAKQNHDSD